MANYYTAFSTELNLGQEANTWLYRVATAVKDGLNWAYWDDPEEVFEVSPDIKDVVMPYLQPDAQGYLIYEELGCDLQLLDDRPGVPLWIHAEGSPNLDLLVTLIQATLVRFERDEVVAFAFAEVCDKPRLDAFGGGAYVITRHQVECLHTWDWLERTVAALKDGSYNCED